MPKQDAIHIGTSGWNYRHWRGPFYPNGLRQADWLAFYRKRFTTVEINNSFYILPSENTFLTWHRIAGDDFLFAVKASRFITHMKKLRDPQEPIERLFSRVAALGPALGPILFQLPPRWKCNLTRLEEFLAALPQGYRYTIEFRDESWWNREVYELLRRRNVSFCVYDRAGRQSPFELTADFAYVRLHGPEDAYQGLYGHDRLASWARTFRAWLGSGRTVYCYFDNDQFGYAPQDALHLKALLQIPSNMSSNTENPKARGNDTH